MGIISAVEGEVEEFTVDVGRAHGGGGLDSGSARVVAIALCVDSFWGECGGTNCRRVEVVGIVLIIGASVVPGPRQSHTQRKGVGPRKSPSCRSRIQEASQGR